MGGQADQINGRITEAADMLTDHVCLTQKQPFSLGVGTVNDSVTSARDLEEHHG